MGEKGRIAVIAVNDLEEMFREEAGYTIRPPEELAVRSLLRQESGTRALLCEGPPGCGKTALGEALACVLGYGLVYYQCHSWTSDEDLYLGVHVPSAVAGDAGRVEQHGVLRRVADATREGSSVVLVIDELDKAPERAEALLLDWLQSGRVPVRPGEHVATDLSRVIVMITSNGVRLLSDALMRRVRRLRMLPMDKGLMVELVARATGAPMGVVRLAVKAGMGVAREERSHWSLQEAIRLVSEVMTCCESVYDLRESVAGWAAKTIEGVDYAHASPYVAPLWGEILRHRRAGG